MQPGPAQRHDFPTELSSVPAETRASETFAFIPGALSIGALLSVAGMTAAISSFPRGTAPSK